MTDVTPDVPMNEVIFTRCSCGHAAASEVRPSQIKIICTGCNRETEWMPHMQFTSDPQSAADAWKAVSQK